MNKMSFDIYRKPTTSDSIIPNDSCHPLEHKLATIRYFANKINTYDHDHVKKQKQIIHNNKYDTSILNRVHNNKIKQEQDNQQKRWAEFKILEEKQGTSQNFSKIPT